MGDSVKYLKIMIIIAIIFLGGCDLGNTPTSKTEEMFAKYQKLDADVTAEIDEVVQEGDLSSDYQNRYRKVLEKQYRNLTYEIKDEKIDGDNATVTVEIEVIDYKKSIEDLNSNDYSLEEYNNLKLDKLEKAKDKVKYTLEIGLLKDKDGNWKLKALSNTDIKKIQGMY